MAFFFSFVCFTIEIFFVLPTRRWEVIIFFFHFLNFNRKKKRGRFGTCLPGFFVCLLFFDSFGCFSGAGEVLDFASVLFFLLFFMYINIRIRIIGYGKCRVVLLISCERVLYLYRYVPGGRQFSVCRRVPGEEAELGRNSHIW